MVKLSISAFALHLADLTGGWGGIVKHLKQLVSGEHSIPRKGRSELVLVEKSRDYTGACRITKFFFDHNFCLIQWRNIYPCL